MLAALDDLGDDDVLDTLAFDIEAIDLVPQHGHLVCQLFGG